MSFELYGKTVHKNLQSIPDTQCIALPIPPSIAHLRPLDVAPDSYTDFESDVSFGCNVGMKFEDDFDQERFNVTCKPINVWVKPATDDEWPRCVESKTTIIHINYLLTSIFV